MISQLGNEIINYFDAPGRDGLNENGVEIDFILVSTEVTSNWDRSINNLATGNDFEFSSIDAFADRSQEAPAGFAYFRGSNTNVAPGALNFGSRRRIVVIDNTNPAAPIIRHNDLPLFSGSLGSTNVSLIRAAINVATPGSPGTDFEAWSDGFNFPDNLEGPDDDADGDCASNLFEFFSGTNPVDGTSSPDTRIDQTEAGLHFYYPQAKGRIGVTHNLQLGPLYAFVPFTPDPADVTTTSLDDNIDEIRVTLPEADKNFIRQIISQTP